MQHHFLQMIKGLREREEILLFENSPVSEQGEESEVIDFLRDAYIQESLAWPHVIPEFSAAAALWAAQTVYSVAQLILYREDEREDLEKLLPDFEGEFNTSAMLSADLCLRFMPDALFQLKMIDPQDELIDLLEKKAHTWHYSHVRYPLETEGLSFDGIVSNPCMHQLYVDRIIENKTLRLAGHPACSDLVRASLGMHGEVFWKEFKLVRNHE